MQYIRPVLCFLNRNRVTDSLMNSLLHNKENIQKHRFKMCQTSIVMFSLSWFSSQPKSATGTNDEQEKHKRQELLATADSLFHRNKHREIYDLLNPYKDSCDVEILWRLVRAQYNLAQDSHTSPEERKTLVYNGYETICRSLELDETHYANHKWVSIMVDQKSCYEGIKERIKHLDFVKQHMMRAVELNPRDATTLYMLGVWCFEIANMPWYQRKIASAIFTTPPNSSFEEALEYFTKAEQTEPRFYSMNLLMLGKTYIKLKKLDRAKYYLDLASNYLATTDEDMKAVKEASELLKSI